MNQDQEELETRPVNGQNRSTTGMVGGEGRGGGTGGRGEGV